MNRSAKKSTGSGDTGSDTRLRLLIASTWNGGSQRRSAPGTLYLT
jgi:hypothetical protein